MLILNIVYQTSEHAGSPLIRLYVRHEKKLKKQLIILVSCNCMSTLT